LKFTITRTKNNVVHNASDDTVVQREKVKKYQIWRLNYGQ